MPRKTPLPKQANSSVVDSTPINENSISPSNESVVDVSASATTPVATKTPRVKKSKEPAKPVEVEATASKPDVSVSLVPEVVEENIVLENGITTTPNEQSLEFFTKLQQLGNLVSQLKTEYRLLEKKWSRDLKNAQKKGFRVKRNGNPNRSPSGFVKPTRISDELAVFLGKESGTEMARTAVTRDINAYIRANNLQDSDNGRKINPDSKLLALLKLQKGEELTYFNLQRYMSPHFYKNVKVEAVSTTTTA